MARHLLLVISLAASSLVLVACSVHDYGRTSSVSATSGSAQADAEAAPDASPYAKAGFITDVQDGRLWVFPVGSEDYVEYKRVGEPAKHTTRIGVGPGGMTMKAPDLDTIIAYLAAKPGYHVEVEDGRVWVFVEGSEALASFQSVGEPAKRVTLLGAGPLGTTVKSDDRAVITAWQASKPGFYTEVVDGRLWVLEAGSESHAEFIASGEPAKSITMIGVGPNGMTMRSDSKETVRAWAASAAGFVTVVDETRVWVFEPASEALGEFKEFGEPAKHTTRIGVGPLGMTIKGPDSYTIDRYLSVVH